MSDTPDSTPDELEPEEPEFGDGGEDLEDDDEEA
jgi:hypothetical protein